MTRLSNEAKEAIVLKAINRGSTTIEAIAKANNVGWSSLQKWLRRYRESKPLSLKIKNNSQSSKLSRAEQFNHVLATHGLDEVSLGIYCRENGLYSHQLTSWRDLFMQTDTSTKNKQQQLELKELKAKYRALERELARKEKALAEASALLILKKKADLIWGVGEEN